MVNGEGQRFQAKVPTECGVNRHEFEKGIERLWQEAAGVGSWRDFRVQRIEAGLKLLRQPGSVVVTADVGQAAEAEIEVSVKGSVLTVKSQKQRSICGVPSEWEVMRMELPGDVEARRAKAYLNHGVLKVRFPVSRPVVLPRAYLRACPVCHGDLFHDEDEYTCLQCGRHLTVEQAQARAHQLAAASQPKSA